MAKISKKDKTKNNIKQEIKNATPIIRKLRKVRVNVKRIVPSDKMVSSALQQGLKSANKIRSCSVRLKRISTNPLSPTASELQSERQINKNKLNNQIGNKAIVSYKPQTNGVAKRKRAQKEYVNTKLKNVTKITNCEVLGQVKSNTAEKSKIVNRKPKESKSRLQSSNTNVRNIATRSKQTEAAKIRDQNRDATICGSIKTCIVNIDRKLGLPSSIRGDNKNYEVGKPPVTSKTKITLFEPPSNKIKNCVVRIRKTPFSKINNIVYKNSDSTTSAIDDEKRRDFRKLSLTQPLRKVQKRIETKSITNSKYKTDFGEKPQEKHNCNTNIESRNHKENPGIEELKIIKLNPKLSLRKQTALRNKKIKYSEDTQIKKLRNSTICFEPMRNSTLLETEAKKSNRVENSKEVCNEHILSPKKKSMTQNLANKSEEIENLLNSLDDEDEVHLNSQELKKKSNCIIKETNNNIEMQNHNTAITNKNKFFHRSKEDVSKISQGLKSQKIKSAKSQVTKKRCCQTKRSTILRRENVYEFLSQSQTSDSDGAKRADPTADIVKKLILQGKVRVATNCKGKGKPILKRIIPRMRQNKKIKQIEGKKSQKIKNKTKITPSAEEQEGDSSEHDHELLDHFEDMEIPNSDMVSNRLNNNKYTIYENDQDGTFSRLARSALMNQTGRSNVQLKNPSNLLAIVREIVSTPKNKNVICTQNMLQSDLSPIAMLPNKPGGNTSPWRVTDDSYLPKTFNFYRSSANLPSFSSDVINQTPRKNKLRIQNSHHQNVECEKSLLTQQENLINNTISNQSLNRDNTRLQTPILNAPSTISSFSSNDSNAENISPPKCMPENYNENDRIFDLKQLPNPRRVLNCRSPLKTINILEVVHLPPSKHHYVDKTSHSENIIRKQDEDALCQGDNSALKENLVQKNKTSEKTKHIPKEDLFGFEDFLSQTEFSSPENNETLEVNESLVNKQNQTIHEKLQDLGKLKPPEIVPQQTILENSRNYNKNMPLFDCNPSNNDGMRQQNIKEMLSSTTVNMQPSTSKEALRMLNNRYFKDTNPQHLEDNSDSSELFKDNDHETTLNNNDPHRTYTRPYKRKRCLKQSKYLVVLTSDESEDEENSDLQKKHDSLETNTRLDHPPRKKINRKNAKEKPEEIKFIEEFNALVKEVDEYKLIVEKTT